ncbi:uncharacterized protein ColSpa_10825 [Colletotrichum spaethianum]|uniref:Uncharacterized protein n=1 Tax=Colletotrichum spaethianum TaxID=700344 RepID=A0AA37PEB9_9PEZI|nr:uncharacterized protein ColSpa_10825 [Colletotrichum spaethianum]GKT50644.1 hypothetical protein ColSpa_10825 [Colletotrichum spaethianum]
METNISNEASGSSASVKAFDGDPFAVFPVEIHKEILDDLDHRGDVLAISQASPAVRQTAHASGNFTRQFLETELGPAQLRRLLHDALAVVMFPVIASITDDADKKAKISKHLQNWKSGELYQHANDVDKMAAYTFIDQVVIPFAEDFAALTKKLGRATNQIRVPEWAHASRCDRAPSRVNMIIWQYQPEERVRLVRAFCRFEFLSKVVQARPSGQLYTLSEQRNLLAEFFDAWEVEEILCVQLYIGDMHTILLETHMTGVIDTMAADSYDAHCGVYNPERRFIRLRRGPFGNGESDDDEESEYESDGSPSLTVGSIEDSASSSLAQGESENDSEDSLDYYDDTSDDSEYDLDDIDEGDWFTKTDHEANPGTPCAKFELADHEKHTVFIKQVATFGLKFLQHFIKSDKKAYSRWIRANGHIILNGMASFEQAKYFGPLGERDASWMARLSLDPMQLVGLSLFNSASSAPPSSATDNSPPATNADLSYGRFPGINEAASNTAWKQIYATIPQVREALRRCGWVFWSEARLRANVFALETLPLWLYHPIRPYVINPTSESQWPESLLFPHWSDGIMMDTLDGGGLLAPLLWFSSAAEMKLLEFLAQNRERRGKILFRAHPFDFFRYEEIPLDVWQECMGDEDPAVPAGTVQVFPNIFWG